MKKPLKPKLPAKAAPVPASLPERLPITRSVIKKLFAYSGNCCTNPACNQELVDAGGTMLGKVAHIHAAKHGARHDPALSDEQRRAFENLLVVCSLCHDRIDDPDREAEFPPELLRVWKERHEARFRRAEAQFVDRYRDSTASAEPNYPKRLDALAAAISDSWMVDSEDHVRTWVEFIDRLRRLPLPTRDFAIKVAQRMKDRDKKRLPVDDVISAFGIDATELNSLGKVLRDHELGDVDEYFGEYEVELKSLDWDGGNPFIHMLDFCAATGTDIAVLLYDLNFAKFDNDR
ncbi:hypothetical protein ASE70_01980 [Sphingomonas sp. Leaf22]|uniref:hypothetical protein n=1 Tax=Sphingomonas sp. Leaf22 TaxID=1735687 RepID=UPI000701EE41|nr:hypothetical protein [Sphingomonas sp. Leaf22]KQM90210.1 hypothetical protein ASE70_01980 [Sphingomonas sp. Leaf22]